MLVHISPSISDPSHSQLRTCSSSPIEAMLPHITLLVASITNKQVCWAPPQVFAHINNMIVSHGAQPWPWPMSFLGARRGHFWVSTRPFQKFNEKSLLTTVSHFGAFFFSTRNRLSRFNNVQNFNEKIVCASPGYCLSLL